MSVLLIVVGAALIVLGATNIFAPTLFLRSGSRPAARLSVRTTGSTALVVGVIAVVAGLSMG